MGIENSTSPVGHLFGSSSRHARVVVVTITDTEFPIAHEVFSRCGELTEIDHLDAYGPTAYEDSDTLPFLLVQATDRGNLPVTLDMAEWMRQFRPTAFIVVGTAGGVWRPTDADRTRWSGNPRGDVVLSEYVHYGDYRKVSAEGNRLRHHRLEQPSSLLIKDARTLARDPGSWHRWMSDRWKDAGRMPEATQQEFLVGEQIQDDPFDATQQFLMRTFDRAAAAEMESAGIGQALHSLRVDATYAPLYLSVRGVSDLIWARAEGKELTPRGHRAWARPSTRRSIKDMAGDAKDKTSERALWSPRAAEAASAFALALVQRIASQRREAVTGHPEIPPQVLSGCRCWRLGSTCDRDTPLPPRHRTSRTSTRSGSPSPSTTFSPGMAATVWSTSPVWSRWSVGTPAPCFRPAAALESHTRRNAFANSSRARRSGA